MRDGKLPPVWSGRKRIVAGLRPVWWQRCALGALYVVFALALVSSLSGQQMVILLIALTELTAAYLAVFVALSGGHR